MTTRPRTFPRQARAIVLAAAMAIGSCAPTSRVAGEFAGDDDPYTGTIVGERIEMVSRKGNRCTGSFGSINPFATRLTSCVGDIGTVIMTCTDGRRVTAGFVAASCSSGMATGADQYGRPLNFSYTRE
ncbi:MAG: hypothetical protein JNL66_17895 [Alphaproteobacteria bacterium]|nr:hypothetical protein [Alphaproteobacteria bacterium]